MHLFFKQESISCSAIAPCLRRTGGDNVVSTKVETFPPGAGPESIIRSKSFPKICATSSAVRVFRPPDLLALVAVNGQPTVSIKRRVHSFFGKRIPTFRYLQLKHWVIG